MTKNPGVTISNWLQGCNSMLPPDDILTTQYSWLINGLHRGGIIQTRPGYRSIASIPGSRVQGGRIFTPKNSRPMALIAVDGLIYFGKFPFTSFKKVEGLKFSATAPIINFCKVLKSAKLNTDLTIELIEPREIVIIQDGETEAGVFDGGTGKHSTEGAPSYGVPVGLWMVWTASRLWVFNGSRGKVSDLAMPDSFSETTYLAERSNFDLPGDVTGAIETADEKSLLVFTDTTTTAFQSSVRDRTQWSQYPHFQKVILPSVGCVAGRSVVNQYGLTWWFSGRGLINLDAAMSAQQTSRLSSADSEMMRSTRNLSPNLSGICATSFENFLLVSVPSGGRYNEQTWVADQTPSATDDRASASMSWAGIWTGTRPVEWMKTRYGGRERIYYLSFDATAKDNTQIHLWEAFRDDRQDDRGRIACQLETGMISATELARFRYCELDLCEVLGDVELKIFVGGKRGKWHQIKSTSLQAEVGSLGGVNQRIITKESILEAYKPQTRYIKSDEFSPQDRGVNGPESSDIPGLDKGFQLLIEWRGRMGIQRIKFVMDQESSSDVGSGNEGESGSHNILTEQGEGVTS